MKVKIVVWAIRAIFYAPVKVFVGLCWLLCQILGGLAVTITIIGNYTR